CHPFGILHSRAISSFCAGRKGRCSKPIHRKAPAIPAWPHHPLRIPHTDLQSLLSPDLRHNQQGQSAQSAPTLKRSHSHPPADFGFRSGHLEHQYLETEADKVAYFHRKLGIPLPVLPGRIYKGIESHANTKRYFVDRSPIFIPCGTESLFLPLAPTFVYCDSTEPGMLRYIGHLRTYEHLLNQLPSFNFVYAAANDTKFKRAGKFFARLFTSQGSLDRDRLLRYFKIRQLWEDHKTSALTRPDRQLLRDGDRRFHSQVFQDAYRRWAASNLSRTDLNDVLRKAKAQESRLFSTCVLPDDYDIFERRSKDYTAHQAGTISQNRSSRVGSSLASTPVPPNSLELH